MSLNYSLSNIADWRNVCIQVDGRLTVKTETLIFTMMHLGYSQITAEAAPEIFRRLDLWQHGIGHTHVDGHGKPLYFTLNDVQRHVGLSVNVAYVPTQRWNRWFKEVLLQHVKDRIYSHDRRMADQRNKVADQLARKV